MSGIDHAAEADAAAAAGKYDVAQYHATRLLVAEHRTANLIQAAAWNDKALQSGIARTSDGDLVDWDAQRAKVDAIFAAVRGRLGLS